MFSIQQNWLATLLAIVAGAGITLSLAPFNIWPLSFIAPGLLTVLLFNTTVKKACLRVFLFWLSVFGFGSSWVYVSIHDFGFTGAPLAVVMTLIFVSFLAFVAALPFMLFVRYVANTAPNTPWRFLLGIPAIWLLSEWLRSWLLTGFPWLYSGYAHTDTLLAAWAPVAGVWGLSYISVLYGNVTIALLHTVYRFFTAPAATRTATGVATSSATSLFKQPSIILFAVTTSILWPGAIVLDNVVWTKKIGQAETVAILQPNVPLFKKWNPLYHPDILSDLEEGANALWDTAGLQIWPEAAIPSVIHNVEDFTASIHEQATTHNTTIFTGVLYDDPESRDVYNSILSLGQGSGLYHKQKLVPFGEYVPLEKQLRGLIQFFNLPSSVIRVGPHITSGLQAKSAAGDMFQVSPFICYEIVYPDFVAEHAHNSDLMLTISNDAWFGDSIGPLQHFQMARMRALENQKYLIRATNTGISAIIDHKGKVLARTAQFEASHLHGTIERYRGQTPYSRLQAWPLLLWSIISLISCLLLFKRSKTTIQQS